jgi:hypothetical protein
LSETKLKQVKKLVQKTGLPKHGELYELHRLLGALLSQDLTIDQKLDINVQ